MGAVPERPPAPVRLSPSTWRRARSAARSSTSPAARLGDGQVDGVLLARAADRRRWPAEACCGRCGATVRRMLGVARDRWRWPAACCGRTRSPTTTSRSRRARALAELQHIGKLRGGQGPDFINEYEVYADRHFLREGAPVEPAEYRNVTLPLQRRRRSDQERLGRPRLLPALDARTVPLDRHAPLAGGKPPAVDLPPRLSRGLLPAVAPPGHPVNTHPANMSRWANRAHCPTAARPEAGPTSRCAR